MRRIQSDRHRHRFFLLAATAHDEETVGTLRRALDGAVEVRNEDGLSARVVGLDGVRSGWHAFDRYAPGSAEIQCRASFLNERWSSDGGRNGTASREREERLSFVVNLRNPRLLGVGSSTPEGCLYVPV